MKTIFGLAITIFLISIDTVRETTLSWKDFVLVSKVMKYKQPLSLDKDSGAGIPLMIYHIRTNVVHTIPILPIYHARRLQIIRIILCHATHYNLTDV